MTSQSARPSTALADRCRIERTRRFLFRLLPEAAAHEQLVLVKNRVQTVISRP